MAGLFRQSRIDSGPYRVFSVFNYIFLVLMAVLCLLPLLNVLSISFSSPHKAMAGMVKLWPVDFNIESYAYLVSHHKGFWNAMLISLQRVILGTSIGVFLTILCSYPLSKDTGRFKARKYYVWYFFFTMLFGGGLIPGFMVVRFTGLIDKIWALVIPGAISTFNIILMLNFFRQLPRELEEAAFIDGASHWQILWRVFVPLSKASIATVILFTMVGHWNAWFDAIIYMRKSSHYPLQTYLQSMLTVDITRYLSARDTNLIEKLSPKTLRASQIFIAALPILMVYPLLQKHFTKGLLLGSVKG